jgi:hypothetical protein
MTCPRILLPRAPGSSGYLNFINFFKANRPSKPTDYYVEDHHVWPVSVGGDESKTNKVWLKPNEHLIAHKMLVECFPDKPKLQQAYWFMSNKDGEELTPDEYEELRLACLDGLRTNLGRVFSKEWRQRIGDSHRKKTISDDHKDRNFKTLKER